MRNAISGEQTFWQARDNVPLRKVKSNKKNKITTWRRIVQSKTYLDKTQTNIKKKVLYKFNITWNAGNTLNKKNKSWETIHFCVEI